MPSVLLTLTILLPVLGGQGGGGNHLHLHVHQEEGGDHDGKEGTGGAHHVVDVADFFSNHIFRHPLTERIQDISSRILTTTNRRREQLLRGNTGSDDPMGRGPEEEEPVKKKQAQDEQNPKLVGLKPIANLQTHAQESTEKLKTKDKDPRGKIRHISSAILDKVKQRRVVIARRRKNTNKRTNPQKARKSGTGGTLSVEVAEGEELQGKPVIKEDPATQVLSMAPPTTPTTPTSPTTTSPPTSTTTPIPPTTPTTPTTTTPPTTPTTPTPPTTTTPPTTPTTPTPPTTPIPPTTPRTPLTKPGITEEDLRNKVSVIGPSTNATRKADNDEKVNRTPKEFKNLHKIEFNFGDIFLDLKPKGLFADKELVTEDIFLDSQSAEGESDVTSEEELISDDTEDTTEDNELVTDECNTEMENPPSSICTLQQTTEVPSDEDEGQEKEEEEGEDKHEGEHIVGEETQGVDEVVSGLESTGMSPLDQSIMITLMELEELRGKQQDMRGEIQEKLTRLETLLEEEENNEVEVESLVEGSQAVVGDGAMKPRGGKSLDSNFINTAGALAGQLAPLAGQLVDSNVLATAGALAGQLPALVASKVQGVTAAVHLFENLQRQVSSLLQARVHFLQLISQTIQREIIIFQQTIEFLRRLVNFKLDQSEMLLGKMNPITEILQSGSTSIFLLVTRFFESIETVFALKSDFVRVFSGRTMERQEVGLLERIQHLKLNTILPRKMRVLLNIHAHSEELRDMVNEIFGCVGELLKEKKELIKSVGSFVDSQVEFLSGLTGPTLTVPALVEAVQTGTLYKLINYGPTQVSGVPLISSTDLEEMVESMLVGLGDGPSVPLLGPVKPLLVDHRVLGTLAGKARNQLVNRFLARRLSQFLAGSHTVVKVRQGESLITSYLPPLTLGSPCSNEVHLGASHGKVTVSRSSRFSATAGLTLNSHSRPTADLFAHANLHVNMDMTSSFRTSLGKRIFGQCLSKMSSRFPMRVRARALGHAFAKVLVTSVRLEERYTAPNPLLGNFLNVTLGVKRPHLVFNFNIRMDGTLHNFTITNLKLTGCEFKILGIRMFSVCGLVEDLVKKQVEATTRDSFPLRGGDQLREIEKALKMRLGQEVAVPLVLMDGANLEPANKVIFKTGRLIELNVELFHAVADLTRDMEQVEEATVQPRIIVSAN